MNTALRVPALAILVAALTGCPSNNPPADTGVDACVHSTILPADYRTNGFTVVRNCRGTTEHSNPAGGDAALGANTIIVYANAASASDYDAGSPSLANGTLVIKEEHGDDTCSQLLGWSIMHKEPGFDPDHHNWHWQHVLANGCVDRDGIVPGCLDGNCHTATECVSRDYMCTQGP